VEEVTQQRLVLGTVILYSALLLGPVVPLVTGEHDAWGLLAVGCVVGAVVGALATVGREMTAPDASWPLGVAGLVLPLGWFLPAVGESSVEAAVLSPWAVGASASIAWLVVGMGVGALRNAQRREKARTVVAFSAPRPKAQRRQLAVALVVIMGLSVAVTVGIGLLSSGIEVTTLLPLTIVPVFFATLDEDVDCAVTDRGLRVENTVHEWENFAGYECDDGVLSVVSHGRTGTQRFEAEDIEDLDAVCDALGRYLPRLDREY
jgi:hypothetical protein